MSAAPARSLPQLQSQATGSGRLPSRGDIGLKKQPSIVALESIMTDLLELTGRSSKLPLPPVIAAPCTPSNQRAQKQTRSTGASPIAPAPNGTHRSNSDNLPNPQGPAPTKAKIRRAAATAASLRIVTDSSAFQQGCYQPVSVIDPSSNSAFRALLLRSKVAPTLFASLFAPSASIITDRGRRALSSPCRTGRSMSVSAESTGTPEKSRGFSASAHPPQSIGGWIRCIAVLELPPDPSAHHPALHLFPQIPSDSSRRTHSATTHYLPPVPAELPAASFALISAPFSMGTNAAVAAADASLILWNPSAPPVALRPPPQGDGLDPEHCDYEFPLVHAAELFRVVRERGRPLVRSPAEGDGMTQSATKVAPIMPARRSSLQRSPQRPPPPLQQTETQPDYMAQFAAAAAMAADASFAALLAQKHARRKQLLALRIPDDFEDVDARKDAAAAAAAASPGHRASRTRGRERGSGRTAAAASLENGSTATTVAPKSALRSAAPRVVRHVVSFDSAVVETGSSTASTTLRSSSRQTPSSVLAFDSDDDRAADTLPASAAELARARRYALDPLAPALHASSLHSSMDTVGRPSKPCEPVLRDADNPAKGLARLWRGGRVAPASAAEQVKRNLQKEECARKKERDAALIRSLTLPIVM
ncbi:hypothetical protein DFJ73DRAFT_762896 [Zopfochytrium polystomum]|nr:hypothetical protein DFJ73DRAFT_762896 [Zopfochytrium polystomum]